MDYQCLTRFLIRAVTSTSSFWSSSVFLATLTSALTRKSVERSLVQMSDTSYTVQSSHTFCCIPFLQVLWISPLQHLELHVEDLPIAHILLQTIFERSHLSGYNWKGVSWYSEVPRSLQKVYFASSVYKVIQITVRISWSSYLLAVPLHNPYGRFLPWLGTVAKISL